MDFMFRYWDLEFNQTMKKLKSTDWIFVSYLDISI